MRQDISNMLDSWKTGRFLHPSGVRRWMARQGTDQEPRGTGLR